MLRLTLALLLTGIPTYGAVTGQYGPAPLVENIQAMLSRTNPSAINPYMHVGGWRTNGDWGQPRLVRWVPNGNSPTNLGCVFDGPNGQWQFPDCELGELPAEWFGIQSGSTNYATANQTAWLNLVEYAVEDGRNLHKAVKFPTGEFYFDGPLNLYSTNYVAGADYNTGRFRVVGAGQEMTFINLTSATNNGFVGVYSGIFIENLTVGATAERKASRSSVSDGFTGNAIVLIQVSGLPAFHEIKNVVVRDQPNAGLVLVGLVELLSAQNIIALNNQGEGFVLSRQGGGTGPFMNHFLSCRAVGNMTGGWSITNGYNNVFTHCEAIDNFGEAHWRIFSGVNSVLDNIDTESPSAKVAPASPLTTNTLVIGTNRFIVPGFDFNAAGVSNGHYMIVSGSRFNDRAWQISGVTNESISVEGTWGWNNNEVTNNLITLSFTRAIPGVAIRGSVGTRIVGGYWGTLPSAIIVQNAPETLIDRPLFVNVSLTGWSGSECVLRTTAGSTNMIFKFRETEPVGFITKLRDQFGDTQRHDVLEYGSTPQYMRIGPNTGGTDPLWVWGGESGGSVIKLYRPSLDQNIGFGVSQWETNGKLNIIEANNFQVIAGGVGDQLEPRWFIGQDGSATFQSTNVLLAVGRRITGETNANGVSMYIQGQAGTGTGQSGWVALGNFDQTIVATNAQSAVKYRLGVHPGGVKIHDVGLTLPSTPYESAALEVTSNAKGFLPPRLTTAQRNALVNPLEGLQLVDTDLSVPMFYDGANWQAWYLLPSGGTSANFLRGDNVFTSTLMGDLTVSNAAPILNVMSGNGSSGFRINVTGVSGQILRLQSNSTTVLSVTVAGAGVLNTVANLTGGTSSNFLAGDGTFKSVPAASTNSGAIVRVDGGANKTIANFIDTSEINFSESGDDVSAALIDGSIATNRIDTTFYNLLMATTTDTDTGTNILVNGTLVSLANLQDDTGAGGINWAVSGSNIKAYATNVAHGLTFTNGLTNSADIVQLAVTPGANITLTTNNGQITIAASTGVTNSGTAVSVDGAASLAIANLADSTELNPTASGSNITYAIVTGSITSNKIASGNITLDKLSADILTLWQATNATLTRLGGIGSGTSGDILYRDATGWTNLAKSSNSKVLTLTAGLPSWQDSAVAGGYISKSVSQTVVSNTTDETVLYTWTVPASTLSSDGDELEIYVPAKYTTYSSQPSGYTWTFYKEYGTGSQGSVATLYSATLNASVETFASDWTFRLKRMSSTNAMIILKHTTGANTGTNVLVQSSRVMDTTLENGGWGVDTDFSLTITHGVANAGHITHAKGYTVRKLQ